MLKREWAAESNGKLPHLFLPSETATLFAEFAVKPCPWTEYFDNDDDDDDDDENHKILTINMDISKFEKVSPTVP